MYSAPRGSVTETLAAAPLQTTKFSCSPSVKLVVLVTGALRYSAASAGSANAAPTEMLFGRMRSF